MGERASIDVARWFAAGGAIAAAAGVALAAYSSHGVGEPARAGLSMAAVLLLCHGIALTVLGRSAYSSLARAALLAIISGSVLFAGSLLAAQLAGVPARLAPAAGMLMIVGWVFHAVASLRD